MILLKWLVLRDPLVRLALIPVFLLAGIAGGSLYPWISDLFESLSKGLLLGAALMSLPAMIVFLLTFLPAIFVRWLVHWTRRSTVDDREWLARYMTFAFYFSIIGNILFFIFIAILLPTEIDWLDLIVAGLTLVETINFAVFGRREFKRAYFLTAFLTPAALLLSFVTLILTLEYLLPPLSNFMIFSLPASAGFFLMAAFYLIASLAVNRHVHSDLAFFKRP